MTDKESVRLLCCGFGVGLSWGIVYANIDTQNILPVIETDECYEEDKTPTGPMKERTVVVYGADTPLVSHCAVAWICSQQMCLWSEKINKNCVNFKMTCIMKVMFMKEHRKNKKKL